MNVRNSRRQRGSMAAELTILAPVILVFLLVLVGLGRVVEARGQVNGAARAAARAASVQRSYGAAQGAAERTAREYLRGDCVNPPTVRMKGLPSDFTEGALVTYQVTCEIDLHGLVGLVGSGIFTATATVPLDTYRRIG